MNIENIEKAAAIVGNPNILVNLVSRRVRQLNGGGGSGRPLLHETGTMGNADIAIAEMVEGKMTWEYAEDNPLPQEQDLV